MPDPNNLTEADIDNLTGDDLARAVAWWIEGDDLTRPLVNGESRAIYSFCVNGISCKEQNTIDLDRWCAYHGCTYRAEDLIAHVAAYRAKPKPLTVEYAMSMFSEGMPLCFDDEVVGLDCVHPTAWEVTTTDDNTPLLSSAPDPATAIFRAALKVAMRTKANQSQEN